VDPLTRKKLELVLAVRQFAQEELQFEVGNSYTTLADLAKPPTVYVVSAAYGDRLEPYTWWFPIVGRVAYKGFFSEASARSEATRLAAKGYDTYVRTAIAFSTLGWFADPLLPQLLRYEAMTLTNVILHELFHNTFYLSGQTAFNESLANFAGSRAAIAFFAGREGLVGERYRQAVAAWEDELTFSRFLAQAAERLEKLYRASLSPAETRQKRQEIFIRLQEEFRRLPLRRQRDRQFAEKKLNNAVILHYLLYLRELALFEQMYWQGGEDLPLTLKRITTVAKNGEDPFTAVRLAVETSKKIHMVEAARRLTGSELLHLPTPAGAL
jgi:predicted aminopeptidase